MLQVRRLAVCLSALALACASPALAGPLAPPTGPVAPTGPTVIDSLPYTINAPGTYILTGNLTGVALQSGITIASADVTIDLGGFSLIGVPSSLDGIRTSGVDIDRISVQNGVVRDWGQDGVDLGAAESSIVTGVRAAFSGNDGIRLRSGVIEGCTVENNGGDGMDGAQNVTVRGSTAHNNGATGIDAGVISTVSDCAAYNNGGIGILVGSASAVLNCSSQQNGGDGFSIGFSSSIQNCNARANDGDGIESSDGGVITDCTVDLNDLHGIRVDTDATVRGNNCTGNGQNSTTGAGVYANSSDNRIEGNNCVDNDRGITVVIGGCFVVKNSASGNGLNYSIAGTNTIGPIISTTGTITTTNPWANFSY